MDVRIDIINCNYTTFFSKSISLRLLPSLLSRGRGDINRRIIIKRIHLHIFSLHSATLKYGRFRRCRDSKFKNIFPVRANPGGTL